MKNFIEEMMFKVFMILLLSIVSVFLCDMYELSYWYAFIVLIVSTIISLLFLSSEKSVTEQVEHFKKEKEHIRKVLSKEK